MSYICNIKLKETIMSELKHIQKLVDEVANIDKAIEHWRQEISVSPLHEEPFYRKKIMGLQEMAGKKEKEIERLRHLNDLSGNVLSETIQLLYRLKQTIGDYSHIEDEIPEVVELVNEKLQEFDDEHMRRTK